MKHIVSKNNLFKILLFIFEKLMKLPNKHFEIFPHRKSICSLIVLQNLLKPFLKYTNYFSIAEWGHIVFYRKKSTFHPQQNKIHFVNFIAIYD